MKVYKAIASVSSKLSEHGISKSRRNSQQGYQFRGIDDVYNAISRALPSCGLVIVPKYKNRTVTERTTKKGGVLLYVTVEAEFDFVSVEDGSVHTASTFGEAMDSGDKATNKAMSAAYKYAIMQTFCIPTDGDNDADATTHQIAALNNVASSDLTDAVAYTKTEKPIIPLSEMKRELRNMRGLARQIDGRDKARTRFSNLKKEDPVIWKTVSNWKRLPDFINRNVKIGDQRRTQMDAHSVGAEMDDNGDVDERDYAGADDLVNGKD
jgi:ERF superfamily